MSNLEYVGGQWNPVGTYTGPPPGGAVRPFLPSAGSPYSAAQWQQLAPAKRKGFTDRASYLRWWHRTVEPKLKKKAAGQTVTPNPHGGPPQATAAVDNAALTPATPKDPRELAIERSIQERQRYSLGQAEAAGKIMAALASVQGGEPGQIRDAYLAAADRTVDYAQGMTGELGAQAGSAAQEAAATIAQMGAPGTGITSESAAINNTLNYTGGYIPGTNLAAEAANQMTNALTQNKASAARMAELGMQQLRDEAKEIEKLRYEAIDLQGTIKGEKAKADLDEREMALKEKAFLVQVGQLQLANAKNAFEQAEAMTNLTGHIYVVKNGKAVRTNQVASGSKAFTAAQSAETSRQNAANTNARIAAQNKITNALNAAKFGLSEKEYNIAVQREQRLSKPAKAGGITANAQQLARGKTRKIIEAYTPFQTKPVIKNGKVVTPAQKIPKTPNGNPTPGMVLKRALKEGVPYSLALEVMRNVANQRYKNDPIWHQPWLQGG